jgi:hypothetical protein
MTPEIRLEMLRLVAKNEPERPTRDLMTLAESLTAWVETRRFPEEVTADYRADRKPVSDPFRR